MGNALVPELSVTDFQTSKNFYCKVLGFECAYERQWEGFAYLCLGEAELMIDQVDLGRTFDQGYRPKEKPFGKGVNLQIQVECLDTLLSALSANSYPLMLPVESMTYRVRDKDLIQRQFVVADPDGYLLRFFEKAGA